MKVLVLILLMVFLPIKNIIAESISWDVLASFDLKEKKGSFELQNINSKEITIEGFIVPLELDDFIDMVSEFILVPDPLSCIHVPPPAPNQMIYVKMKKAIPLNMDYRGVSITGTLLIKEYVEDELIVCFEMKGYHAKEANITHDDPLEELFEEFY